MASPTHLLLKSDSRDYDKLASGKSWFAVLSRFLGIRYFCVIRLSRVSEYVQNLLVPREASRVFKQAAARCGGRTTFWLRPQCLDQHNLAPIQLRSPSLAT